MTINRTPAFRVIFNPTPRQYGIAMRESGYASAYQPGTITKTLLKIPRHRAQSGRRVTIPDVAPGVYMVLIFDGTEGGEHKTWDYFQVLGPPPSQGATRDRVRDSKPPSGSPPAAGGRSPEAGHRASAGSFVLVGVVGAALALMAVALRRHMHSKA